LNSENNLILSPLPAWLNFDKLQLKIDGIPTQIDIYQEKSSLFGKIFKLRLIA
jgi:hypothetical protein